MIRPQKTKAVRQPTGKTAGHRTAGEMFGESGSATDGTGTDLFPMFLKIAGRPCLVVGAGAIAKSKIESLVRCGADVRVVAPRASEAIRQLARTGGIVWHRRRFQKADLRGMRLVVAATSSPTLHERIFRQAQSLGILCNAVDEPSRCDFYYPAVMRRGPLQIAVSTGGCAPALAQRLRRELARYFAPEYGPWTEAIGRARSKILASGISPEKRRRMIRKLSSRRAFDTFRKSGDSRGQGRNRRGR